MHLNVRSIKSKLDYIKDMIMDFKKNDVTLHAICLCETYILTCVRFLFGGGEKFLKIKVFYLLVLLH